MSSASGFADKVFGDSFRHRGVNASQKEESMPSGLFDSSIADSAEEQ
jgi:hypothetical protein